MDDREVTRPSLDLQGRARDFRLLDLPGFLEWSRRKTAEGQSRVLLARLGATNVWLFPHDVAGINEADYDELLEDLKFEVGMRIVPGSESRNSAPLRYG